LSDSSLHIALYVILAD